MTVLAPNAHAKVKVKLVGEDGNAFAVLGRVISAMCKAGWSSEDVSAFRKEATSGDYDHLLCTVMDYADEPDEDEESDEDEEDDYEDEEDEDE